MLFSYMSAKDETKNEEIIPEESIGKIINEIRKEKEKMIEHLVLKEKVLIDIYESSLCFVNQRMSLWKWYRSKKTGSKYFSTITYVNNDEIEIIFNRVIDEKSKKAHFYPIVRAYTSGEIILESLNILNEIFPKTESIITSNTEAVLIEFSRDGSVNVSQTIFVEHIKTNIIYSFDGNSFSKISENKEDVIRYKKLEKCDKDIYTYSSRCYCVPIPSECVSTHFYNFMNQSVVF